MEHAKSRTLFLTLELTALAVAGLLILIDYKLKRDLLALFIRIEEALANGQEAVAHDTDGSSDTSIVRASDMVAHPAGMEALRGNAANHANGSAAAAAGSTPNRKRSAGTRSAKVPEPDKPVGA